MSRWRRRFISDGGEERRNGGEPGRQERRTDREDATKKSRIALARFVWLGRVNSRARRLLRIFVRCPGCVTPEPGQSRPSRAGGTEESWSRPAATGTRRIALKSDRRTGTGRPLRGCFAVWASVVSTAIRNRSATSMPAFSAYHTQRRVKVPFDGLAL